MTGGPKARQQMEKKKQLAEQKKAVKKRKRVQSYVLYSFFPFSPTLPYLFVTRIGKSINFENRDVSDSDEDEDDLRFPKSTTEEVYYDFAKKKISKDAMAVVHKGYVYPLLLPFCICHIPTFSSISRYDFSSPLFSSFY